MLQVGEEEAVPVPDNCFDIHKTLMAAIPFPRLFLCLTYVQILKLFNLKLNGKA